MASGDKHEKVCPKCGHCPTCGRSNRPPNYYWPWGTARPWPYWNQPIRTSAGSPNQSGAISSQITSLN